MASPDDVAAGIAVTIDGGNAFQQQRTVQNGSDAASLAGAVKLGNLAACTVWSCAPPTDTDVRGAVDAGAAANGIDVQDAYYTDICGTPLRPDGTAAKQGNQISLSQAAQVGGGVIPPDVGGTANCLPATQWSHSRRARLRPPLRADVHRRHDRHQHLGDRHAGDSGIDVWRLLQLAGLRVAADCIPSQRHDL